MKTSAGVYGSCRARLRRAIVAYASITGAVAGSIIAIIMLIHINSEEAAPVAVQGTPHNACARNGLHAGRPDD